MKSFCTGLWILLLSSLTAPAANNYLAYFKHIALAEEALTKSQFEQAVCIYYNTFPDYDFVFPASPGGRVKQQHTGN